MRELLFHFGADAIDVVPDVQFGMLRCTAPARV